MQGLIMGGVALLLGGSIAGGTAFSLINNQTSGTFQPDSNVLEYGTTNQ